MSPVSRRPDFRRGQRLLRGRDTTRHLLTEGCFLGDLEDKRRVHGGSEIIGMWRNFKRDCGDRDDAVAPFPTGPLAVFSAELAD